MAYTKLIRQQIAGGKVEEIASAGTYRLTLPAGSSGKYRLAQLDD
jgi:hypothetical protein